MCVCVTYGEERTRSVSPSSTLETCLHSPNKGASFPTPPPSKLFRNLLFNEVTFRYGIACILNSTFWGHLRLICVALVILHLLLLNNVVTLWVKFDDSYDVCQLYKLYRKKVHKHVNRNKWAAWGDCRIQIELYIINGFLNKFSVSFYKIKTLLKI